ncbi:MAG: tetratricopeptide repeat protein [Holophagaceae bacterium]|nr:tetratricopeptide repeat protein [Holophagaceae bacterium]
MNITQAARAVLRNHLSHIANSNDSEALQSLLSGAGLPALGRDEEPAEQIHDALESGDHYASMARRIARLLASLILRRADALAHQIAALEGVAMGGGNSLVYDNLYLEDETYVFNLFLLASRLPRNEELFGGLQQFHEVGFKLDVVLASSNNRVGFQLRRSLAEQQHGTGLRDYWLNLLEDKNRTWSPARRTELLEAWYGLLETLDFDADRQDALDTFNTGLRALFASAEHHPQAIGLLELALWRFGNAFPLDPTTWVDYLSPTWAVWPELLQDIAAQIWPRLEPKAHTDMPPLPEDLNELWASLNEEEQNKLRNILQRNASDEGQRYLKDLNFSPHQLVGRSPQEARHLLSKLSEHLWPAEKKATFKVLRHEIEEWGDMEPTRPARRTSIDRLERLNAVNRTLAEIERRLSDGDETTALRFLNELLDQQRNTDLADQHLHTAKTLANAATIVQSFGKLEWAESMLREACKENDNDVVSANGLADVLKERGELKAAEAQYRQNMMRWPNYDVSANGLADVLKARGKLEAAEAQYRQNMMRWPNNEVSACGLADVLKTRGELEAAEGQYRQNMAHWPNDQVSACGLADVLKTRGELEEAEAQYRQNMARWPNNVVSACGLADVLKTRGELEAAETQYRQNIMRWPNNVVSACGLADVLKTRGELKAAEAQYRQNMARWPNDQVSACGLADVLKTRGELEAAEAQYRQNMARWPNDEFSACGLAGVLKTRGELEAAEAQYRQNMARWPNNEVSANGLAGVLKTRGELETAEAQYRQNMARWPNDQVSACGLADVLKTRGELEAAEAQYRQNMARWPNDQVSACGLADVLKTRGELEAAEAQYRQNMARWPNDEVSANGLADVLKSRGELETAEAQYRQNMTRWPNDHFAINGLANVLRKQKRYVEALALLPMSSGESYDLHLRSMILLDLGRFMDARGALEQGLNAAICPKETAIFHSGLALLALRAQDFKRAGEILATLPDNVISIDLMRLHLEAAQNHRDAASRLTGELSAQEAKMNFGEANVFKLVHDRFGLSAAGVGRQPLETEMDEIFDAEIELQLAA